MLGNSLNKEKADTIIFLLLFFVFNIMHGLSSNLCQPTENLESARSPFSISCFQTNIKARYVAPENIKIQLAITGSYYYEPAYIVCKSIRSDYSKANIGYDSKNIYAPGIDVTATGNDSLEIKMKVFGNPPDWDRISMRPNETSDLPLKKYVQKAVMLQHGWFIIKIPLADFKDAQNFKSLSYVSLPYSSDAGIYTIAISEIVFYGGKSPFVWFGGAKINNAIAGSGKPGELLASFVPAFIPSDSVDYIEVFCNDKLINHIKSEFEQQIELTIAQPGRYHLFARLTDTRGRVSYSDTIWFEIKGESDFVGQKLYLKLNDTAQVTEISKTTLLYDKDFAYSLTLDDGLSDAFTNVYPILAGGYCEESGLVYPGVCFTDGCGTRKIFTAALALYSVNGYAQDLHLNTPGYIRWNEIKTMYNQGWDVLNHSWSHAAYNSEIDYLAEVSDGEKAIFTNSGIRTTGFVVPSGDLNYVEPAHLLGYRAVYSEGGNFTGYGGLLVDTGINVNRLNLVRKNIYSPDTNPDNVMENLNRIAAMCDSTHHFWYNEFTHNVKAAQANGGLQLAVFENYMRTVEQRYGVLGSDRIWMAPVQTIFEFLWLNQSVNVDFIRHGDLVTIWVDTLRIPQNLRHYKMTLKVKGCSNFTVLDSSEIKPESYCSSGLKKLINIDLKNKNASNQMVKFVASDNRINVYPNPVSLNGKFNLTSVGGVSGNFEIIVCDIAGHILWSKYMANNSNDENIFSVSDCGIKGKGVFFVGVKKLGKTQFSVLIVH